MRATNTVPVGGLNVHAFEVPTDGPDGQEQDGTATWSSTTIVLAEAHGGGQAGLGYTCGDASVAALISSKLAPVVTGMDALAPAAAWRAMFRALRNAGHPGAGGGVPRVRHLEYFHTHVRLEGLAFDGVLTPAGGALRPDPSRPGLGLAVKWADLEQYRVTA